MVVNETTSSVQTGKKAAVTVAVVAALASGTALAAEPSVFELKENVQAELLSDIQGLDLTAENVVVKGSGSETISFSTSSQNAKPVVSVTGNKTVTIQDLSSLTVTGTTYQSGPILSTNGASVVLDNIDSVNLGAKDNYLEDYGLNATSGEIKLTNIGELNIYANTNAVMSKIDSGGNGPANAEISANTISIKGTGYPVFYSHLDDATRATDTVTLKVTAKDSLSVEADGQVVAMYDSVTGDPSIAGHTSMTHEYTADSVSFKSNTGAALRINFTALKDTYVEGDEAALTIAATNSVDIYGATQAVRFTANNDENVSNVGATITGKDISLTSDGIAVQLKNAHLNLTAQDTVTIEAPTAIELTGNAKASVTAQTLAVTGNIYIESGSTLTTIGGDLTVAGYAQNFGTVTVGGNVVVENAFTNGHYDYEGQNVMNIVGTATIGDSFYQGGVNSVTTIGGNATFANIVAVDQGILNLNGDTNVVKSELFVDDGELNIKGALTVVRFEQDGDSVTTIGGNVTVATNMELDSGILNLNGEENVIEGDFDLGELNDVNSELNAKGSVTAQAMSLMDSKATIAKSLTVKELLQVGYSELSVGSETAVNTFGDVVVAGSRVDITGATNTVGDLKLYGGGSGNVVTFTGNNTVASIWVTEDRHPEDVDGVSTFSLRSVRSAPSSVINFNGSTTIEGTTDAQSLNVEGSIVHGGDVNTGSYNADGATITLNGEENSLGAFNGTGSTLIPSDGSETNIDSFSGSDNTIQLSSLDTQLTVGDDSAEGTTITATGSMNDALRGQIDQLVDQAGGLSGNYVAARGDVFPETTVTVEDGVITNQQTSKHETNEQIAGLSTAVPAMIARVETNDLRKRLGNIRAAEGTHGAWARYDGGKFSGASGFENTFNKVQVGVDSVFEAGAPRFGVAFSYAKGDVDMTGASADMQSYSLSAYGVWMGDSGQFVDVIGRVGSAKSDLTTNTYNVELDQLVLSLSGEFGWRFDVTDQFYVEPSVEATYTRVASDTYAANGNTFKVDSYDSMVARAGFAAGFKCPSNFGEVYVRAAVAHEFMGDAKFVGTTADGGSYPIEVKGKDTWFEYAVGTNFNVNKNTYVYADLERTAGADVETDWRANVGVRFAF